MSEGVFSDCGKVRFGGCKAINKMAEVAKMFGKKIGERFTVRHDNCLFDCTFADCGFIVYGAYDDFDAFLLHYLLIGRAVIIDE